MLLGQIERIAERHPERAALLFNRQSYSYQSLRDASGRLRALLAERGVAKGDRVAVILPNSPHFVIAHLAVVGLGAVSVPISPQHKARDIAGYIEDSEACTLIAWSPLSSETERAVSHTESIRLRIYLGDAIPEGAESFVDTISSDRVYHDGIELSDDDLAAILYTAGVSGRPRGVELTHGNFTAHGQELARLLRIQDADRFLGVLPFSTAVGLTTNVHLPLSQGAQVEIHSRFHPGDVLQSLAEDHITLLTASPTMYSLMAKFPSAERYELNHLRYAISCKGPLPTSVARGVEEKFALRIFDAYSVTETCGIVAMNLFPSMTARGSVGRPLGGHGIEVFDEGGKPATPGTIGRVAVRGPAVMRGYHNRPDKTRHSFRDGWFLTGDWGYLDYDSNLFITGHDSELIMKGGFPVYAREVEEIVEGLPHVLDVAVVGMPDPVYGEEIKACVVLKEGASITPGEIIEYVKERAALYKCPKVVRFYKELPRGPGGKIFRSALKEDRP